MQRRHTEIGFRQSASSYDCDGCSHHASFHSMENKQEDEIRKRWETESREKKFLQDDDNTRPRKRPRQLEYNFAGSIDDDYDDDKIEEELHAMIENIQPNLGPTAALVQLVGAKQIKRPSASKPEQTKPRGGVRASTRRRKAKEASEEVDVVEVN
jgi:hypothetical protein